MKKLLAVSVLAAAVAIAGVATAQKETRGVSKTEIVLGMHTDLSGPAATYGVSSSNAVKMRFDESTRRAASTAGRSGSSSRTPSTRCRGRCRREPSSSTATASSRSWGASAPR